MAKPEAAQLYLRFEQAFNAGNDDERRRALLMNSIADAIGRYGRVPESLTGTIQAVTSAWTSERRPDRDLLLDAKVVIWTELRAKNGDSTTIKDLTDRTLRACLCLTELMDPAEAMDFAGWAAEMLSSEPWPRPSRFF